MVFVWTKENFLILRFGFNLINCFMSVWTGFGSKKSQDMDIINPTIRQKVVKGSYFNLTFCFSFYFSGLINVFVVIHLVFISIYLYINTYISYIEIYIKILYFRVANEIY